MEMHILRYVTDLDLFRDYMVLLLIIYQQVTVFYCLPRLSYILTSLNLASTLYLGYIHRLYFTNEETEIWGDLSDLPRV